MKTTSINTWPEADRPREKLLKNGEKSLSNSELLAILLRTGVKGCSAIDLARKILDKFSTFRNMSHTDLRDWKEVKGLGQAKIAQIKAAIEIGRRFNEDEMRHNQQRIRAAIDIVRILMPQMRDLKKEVFKTVYLDGKNEIIDIVDESSGTVNYTTPIIREIFHKALQNFATSIICIHNHPSGDVSPSKGDIDFTKKLSKASEILHVNFFDHIIIGDDSFYSFVEKSFFSLESKYI